MALVEEREKHQCVKIRLLFSWVLLTRSCMVPQPLCPLLHCGPTSSGLLESIYLSTPLRRHGMSVKSLRLCIR